MNVEGITWHALTLEPDQFAATKKLVTETFGLTTMMEMPGVSVFQMRNGTILELYLGEALPPFGYNEGGVAFGFRVDDIEEALVPSSRPAASCSARSRAYPSWATRSATSAAPTAASTDSTNRGAHEDWHHR